MRRARPGTRPHEPCTMNNLFRRPVALRWSDLDAFNHVNNARYLTFIEQARIEWFDTIAEPWVTAETAPVVASAP